MPCDSLLGKPLPPSGLRVNLQRDYTLDKYNIILLHWNRSQTLFNQDSRESQLHQPTLYYNIYGYINDSESEAEMFYHNKTTDLMHTINIERLVGIDQCNVTEAIFTVSAKYNQVGEGLRSNPIEIAKHDNVDIICSSLHVTLGKENEINFVLLGSFLSTTAYLIVMLMLVICITLTCVRIKHKNTIPIDSDEIEEEIVMMNSNCAYESGNQEKGTYKSGNEEKETVIMNSNCAYESVRKTDKGAVQHKDQSDEVSVKANLAYVSMNMIM